MTRQELIQQIFHKQSFLCIGLDPDPARLPGNWKEDAGKVVDFCATIIQNTQSSCVAYKLNIAFFEALGRHGWEILHEVRSLLPAECFLIADAKRADIGNSSKQYARAFFEQLNFDAVTVAPYMGSDSVKPFLEFEGKWTILLALTSNTGAADFQVTVNRQGQPLFEQVLKKAQEWGTPDNLMFVTGATQTDHLERVRKIAPDHFLLVPGIGAQGGSLSAVVETCMIDDCGLLINSSRDIIYASGGEDFGKAAGARATAYQKEMAMSLQVK